MRFSLSLVLFFILGAGSLPAVDLPAPAKKGTPGKYDLVSNRQAKLLGGPVRASLYVPAGIKRGKTELIVFFHGATRNKAYYKTHVAFLERWAARDGFVLLSMQNPYGFAVDNSRDTGLAVGDAIFAAAELGEALADAGLVDEDKIYATGFSAGGYVALLSIFKKPEVFAGFGSFHGNYYYPGIYYGESGRSLAETSGIYFEEDYEPGMKKLKKKLRGKTAFLAVGGRDVARVKKQVPEARDFFKEMFPIVKVKFRQYPNEGHQFTEANWRDFMEQIR